MLRLVAIFLASAVILIAHPANAAGKLKFLARMENSPSLSIRYFDPANERRTKLSVGDIDLTYDYEINVKCNAMNCRAALPAITEILSNAKHQDELCSSPSYARIQLLAESKKIVDTIYIDYSGKCIWNKGEYFSIDVDLIEFLRDHGVREWAFSASGP
jgi:hypothetical protein